MPIDTGFVECDKINIAKLQTVIDTIAEKACESSGVSVTIAEAINEDPPLLASDGDVFYNYLICPALKQTYDGANWIAQPLDSSDSFLNTRYVTSDGDDLTAIIGSETCKFQTIEAAENAETSNGFVEAHGNYDELIVGQNGLTEVKGSVRFLAIKDDVPIDYTLRAKTISLAGSSIITQPNSVVVLDADKIEYTEPAGGSIPVLSVENGAELHVHAKQLIDTPTDENFNFGRFLQASGVGSKLYVEFDKHINSNPDKTTTSYIAAMNGGQVYIKGKYAEFHSNDSSTDMMVSSGADLIDQPYLDVSIQDLRAFFTPISGTTSIFWGVRHNTVVHDSNIHVKMGGSLLVSVSGHGGEDGKIIYRNCNITIDMENFYRNYIFTRTNNLKSQIILEDCTIQVVNMIPNPDPIGAPLDYVGIFQNGQNTPTTDRPSWILKNTRVHVDNVGSDTVMFRNASGGAGAVKRVSLENVYTNLDAFAPNNVGFVDDLGLAHYHKVLTILNPQIDYLNYLP